MCRVGTIATGAGCKESGATAAEGPLPALLAAQCAELGGPRPLRHSASMEMDAELAALGGSGQLISGQELLALLRGLSSGQHSAPDRG